MATGKQFQFADIDDVGTIHSYSNSGENNIGNGNPTGRQFQDQDDMYTMSGFNVINSTDPDYAGQPNSSRVTVDVSKADRGKEY